MWSLIKEYDYGEKMTIPDAVYSYGHSDKPEPVGTTLRTLTLPVPIWWRSYPWDSSFGPWIKWNLGWHFPRFMYGKRDDVTVCRVVMVPWKTRLVSCLK